MSRSRISQAENSILSSFVVTANQPSNQPDHLLKLMNKRGRGILVNIFLSITRLDWEKAAVAVHICGKPRQSGTHTQLYTGYITHTRIAKEMKLTINRPNLFSFDGPFLDPSGRVEPEELALLPIAPGVGLSGPLAGAAHEARHGAAGLLQVQMRARVMRHAARYARKGSTWTRIISALVCSLLSVRQINLTLQDNLTRTLCNGPFII